MTRILAARVPRAEDTQPEILFAENQICDCIASSKTVSSLITSCLVEVSSGKMSRTAVAQVQVPHAVRSPCSLAYDFRLQSLRCPQVRSGAQSDNPLMVQGWTQTMRVHEVLRLRLCRCVAQRSADSQMIADSTPLLRSARLLWLGRCFTLPTFASSRFGEPCSSRLEQHVFSRAKSRACVPNRPLFIVRRTCLCLLSANAS